MREWLDGVALPEKGIGFSTARMSRQRDCKVLCMLGVFCILVPQGYSPPDRTLVSLLLQVTTCSQ